jgi:predicted metal-binding protein
MELTTIKTSEYYTWINKQISRVSSLTQENDMALQQNKLLDIIDKVNELYELEWCRLEKELKKDLHNRSMLIQTCEDTADNLKKLWENIFAKTLSKTEKELIHMDQYLWHIFSYKKVNCLENDVARDTFDLCKKTQVYVFFQNEDITYLYQNAAKLKSTDFDMLQDVYVVDKDFKWTYVYTHEAQCGPYYISN